MRKLSSAVVEELIADTQQLTVAVVAWGDRWSTYGDQLGHLASPSQIAEIDRVMHEFVAAVRKLGGEV